MSTLVHKRAKKGPKTPEQAFREFESQYAGFVKYRHYDMELEEAVLGICMLETTAFARIRQALGADMFYHGFHQCVFEAMREMYDAGAPIDILTVNNWLYRRPPAHEVWLQNASYPIHVRLTKMTNAVVTSAHLEYWAVLIREMFIERKLTILTTGGMGEVRAREKLMALQRDIDALLQHQQVEDWKSIADLLIELYQHMENVRDQHIIGVPSGFTAFDAITSGFQAGLFYLGARPSVGKTALAVKMVLNQASQEIPVGIISLETSGMRLATRALSMASGIPYWQLIRGRVDGDRGRALFESYTRTMANLPIFISDQPAVTLADIRAKVHKLIFQHKCKIIWIDYLQLVEPEPGAGTREQEVAKMSRGLKLLSMQTGIPIIALAQLSRESEKRQGDAKKPRLIDLRESGSIEQDADGVMLLHRPEKSGILFDENNNSTRGKAELIVAKWRDGETFDHPLYFDGERMDFSETSDEGTPF